MLVELSKEHVENALKISGYSKYRLAKESGVPLRSIQRWFNTDLRINYETLLKLCLIMDVVPDYLYPPFSEEVEDDEGRTFTEQSYHYYEKLSEQTIKTLPERERKRVDQHGVYVAHFSKEDMTFYMNLSRSRDCDQIMSEYIHTLAKLDQIKGASYILSHPEITRALVDVIRTITDQAIERRIKALAENDLGDKISDRTFEILLSEIEESVSDKNSRKDK